jgi:hypothetical protein
MFKYISKIVGASIHAITKMHLTIFFFLDCALVQGLGLWSLTPLSTILSWLKFIICGFLRVLLFPSPIKLTATI